MEQELSAFGRGQGRCRAERHAGQFGLEFERDHRNLIGAGVRHVEEAVPGFTPAGGDRRRAEAHPRVAHPPGIRGAERQAADPGQGDDQLALRRNDHRRRISGRSEDVAEIHDPGSPDEARVAGDQVVNRQQADAVRDEHPPADVVRGGVHAGMEFLVRDRDSSIRKERQAPEVVTAQLGDAEQFAAGNRDHRETSAEGVGHEQLPVVEEHQLLWFEGQRRGPTRGPQTFGNPVRAAEVVVPHLPRPETGNDQRRVPPNRADRIPAGRDGRFHFEERISDGGREGTGSGPEAVAGAQQQEFVRVVVKRDDLTAPAGSTAPAGAPASAQ